MSAPAPFLSRHLGDYLLVAQLSDDPLGTVFRALYAADERRFVRLRVLQSEHLSSAAVLRGRPPGPPAARPRSRGDRRRAPSSTSSTAFRS